MVIEAGHFGGALIAQGVDLVSEQDARVPEWAFTGVVEAWVDHRQLPPGRRVFPQLRRRGGARPPAVLNFGAILQGALRASSDSPQPLTSSLASCIPVVSLKLTPCHISLTTIVKQEHRLLLPFLSSSQMADYTAQATAVILKTGRVFPKKPRGLQKTGIWPCPPSIFSSSPAPVWKLLFRFVGVCSPHSVHPGQARRLEHHDSGAGRFLPHHSWHHLDGLHPRLAGIWRTLGAQEMAPPVLNGFSRLTTMATRNKVGSRWRYSRPFLSLCLISLRPSGVLLLNLSLLTVLCLVLEGFSY